MYHKRVLAILLCCLGYSHYGTAQQTAPVIGGSTFNDAIPSADGPLAAAEDTVHALNILYTRRRVGGYGWIAGSTLGGARTLIAASQKKTVSGTYGTVVVQDGITTEGVLAGLGVMLLFDAYGASKLVRFSATRQAALIADVRAGRPLPPDVRRRLKPRFFRQVMVPYKKVKYKAAS